MMGAASRSKASFSDNFKPGQRGFGCCFVPGVELDGDHIGPDCHQ